MNELLDSPMDESVYAANLVAMGIIAQGVLAQYKNEASTPEKTAALEKELTTYASTYIVPAEA